MGLSFPNHTFSQTLNSEVKMAEPRRLRGHKDTATCCIASRDRPGFVATAGEDGRICWFDMRCKDAQFMMDIGEEAITSLCFKHGNEDIIYVSAGKEVKCFDVNMASASSPLQTYNYNKEEINQIVCNSKADFLACADDSGDIKIIDVRQNCLYKSLRAGHSSICSSVQFVPWRPWEVITGGLDSKLVMWDFSKERAFKVVDFGLPDASASNVGQCLNPAFVHAIAVPDADMVDISGKICVVARGDGVIDVINIESELAESRLKKPSKAHKVKAETSRISNQNGSNRLHLDYSVGGHTAAASCVSFSLFGERGKFVISGGNDKSVKVWSCTSYIEEGHASTKCDLHMNISLNRKVNWLCTTPAESENLVVCDTTKVVKVFSV